MEGVDDDLDGIRMEGTISRNVEPSNFVTGYSNETGMLEVDFDKIGTLLGLTNSIRFIPEKFVKKTRKVFIKFMSLVVTEKHLVLHWKKFLMLPTVIFGGYNGENGM